MTVGVSQRSVLSSLESFFHRLSKYLCECFSGLLGKRRPAASARPSVPQADQRHVDISGTNAGPLSLARRSTGRDLPAAHRHVTRGSWFCFHIPHKWLPGYFKEVLRNSSAVDCGKNKNKNRQVIISCGVSVSLTLTYTHIRELHTWIPISTKTGARRGCSRRRWHAVDALGHDLMVRKSLQVFCSGLFFLRWAKTACLSRLCHAVFRLMLRSGPGISGDWLWWYVTWDKFAPKTLWSVYCKS